MIRHSIFYLTLAFASLTLPTSAQASSAVVSTHVSTPWTGTFEGINGPAVQITTTQSSTGGPFQATTFNTNPASEQQNNNPFFINPNSITQATTQDTAQSIIQLLSPDSTTPLSQRANAIFTTNTTVGGAPMKSSPKTRFRTTPAANAIGNLSNVSFTQVQQQLQTPVKAIFPAGSDLASAYANFMSALQSSPGFLPIFKKIHITALHQLYMYLTGIYTALNMTHIDDMKAYMLTEKTYALNKKTLIVNHLMRVIMAQLNQALRATMPGLAENYAIAAGMTCIQSDKISNPNMFILDLEKSVLATLGLTQLDPATLMAASVKLQKYVSILKIDKTADLQAGMAALNSSNFSSLNITAAQAAALVSALQKVISYLSMQQLTDQLGGIVSQLQSPNSQNPITTMQTTQLQKFVSQCVYAEPLNQEIELSKFFAKALGSLPTQTNNSSATAQISGNKPGTISLTPTQPSGSKPSTLPLTPTQLLGLQGILAFILQRYEAAATTQVSQIIQVLGELNPTYQVLSPSQSVALQTLATAMLPLPEKSQITANSTTTSTPTASLMLENLSDAQRTALAYGLWIFSNTGPNISPAQQQALQSIAIPLKTEGAAYNNLSLAQQAALQTALTAFSAYQLLPMSAVDFGKHARAKLAALDPSSANEQQEADIQKAFNLIQSKSFNSFNQLTQEEQILLLQMFQMVDQIFETRRIRHNKQATTLSYLFSGNIGAQNSLFTSITAGQYEALNAIDYLLQQNLQLKKPLSCADLAAVTPPRSVNPQNPKAWMSPQTALLQLFKVPPTQKPTAKNPHPITSTSYLSILLKLQAQHFSDPALQTVLSTITPSQKPLLQTALTALSGEAFSVNQLTAPTRTVLSSLITQYQTALTQNTSTIKRTTTLLNPNEQALQTVCSVIQATHLNIKMRDTFLWALNQYLLFFNLYAQTLQTISNDPQTPAYSGLTKFATYAQNIQQTLQYESTTNGIAQLVAQTNPPLFFYDTATFRSLRLLPKLAQLIENDSIIKGKSIIESAPYPTFGIEQALLGPDQTIPNPMKGATPAQISNTQSLGSLNFNKFFFLKAPSPESFTGLTPLQQATLERTAATTELTGALPSWINPTSVESSTGTTTLYEPNNVPDDGITGFYLNLPTFQADPNNPGSSLITLFEQPIIAQPNWLNKSGTGSQSNWAGIIEKEQAGIITMLRGCLGDFQSVLDLNIFDPCLTIIFKKALALSSDPKTAAQGNYTPTQTTRCATYITEKQAMLKEQASVQTATSTVNGITNTSPIAISNASLPTTQTTMIESDQGTATTEGAF